MGISRWMAFFAAGLLSLELVLVSSLWEAWCLWQHTHDRWLSCMHHQAGAQKRRIQLRPDVQFNEFLMLRQWLDAKAGHVWLTHWCHANHRWTMRGYVDDPALLFNASWLSMMSKPNGHETLLVKRQLDKPYAFEWGTSQKERAVS